MYSASISGGGGALINGSGSISSTNSNNTSTPKTNFTLTKKSNSFENSSNNISTNNEFKSYLIDKLINENSYPARLNHNNNNNKIEITPSRSDFILSINHANQSKLDTNNDTNNNNDSSSKNVKNKHLTVPSLSKSDSKGDLASETGTYTVDDSPDIANPADLEEDLNIIKSKSKQENNILRQSTNTNVDLMSARAAIDETFGIIKRPSIDIDAQSSTNNSLIIDPNETSKRDKKSTRLRNVTYSLKDIINKQNDNNNVIYNQDSNSNNNNNNNNNNLPQNSSFSESPSSSLSSISDNAANTNKIKKTTTYNIISNNRDIDQIDQKSSITTARTVDTELLLGDTEKLMEQLKRNRQDKKEKLKSKFLINKNNVQVTEKTHLQPTISQLLPSSTSSSSTNVSVDNNNNTNGKKLVSSWIIPSNEDNEPENYVVINTTRATVDSEEATTSTPNQLTMMHLNKVGNGGLAFDFLIDEQKLNKTPPSLKSATILKTKKNSTNSEQNKTRDSLDDESQCSTCCQSDRQSTSRTMDNHSITRNFISRRHHSTKDDNQLNLSNITTNSSTIGSPKSALSLGAKIQIKAKENNNNSISNSPIKKQTSNEDSHLGQYTNRALQLRQLSSKAKLDSHNLSMNKKQTSNSKSISSNRKSTVSAASSRANSRTSSPFGFHNQKTNLMTTSLNLTNGSMLPSNHNSNANDLFKRRKNYDPIKSLEMDKLKKQQNTSVLNTTSKSPRSNSVSLDINSDESNPSSHCKRKIKIDLNNKSKTSIASNSNNKMSESMNSITSNNDSIFDTSYNPNSNSFMLPIQQLANNITNKENYEAIMESTLQRLCIRLIQMSTAVLDKIGDNSSSKGTETNPIFNMAYATELERMQKLAKLVSSMQIVNDHLQIIDSTLFGQTKPEDSYLKELTRIRKEVDSLKQKASLNSSNSSINSSILNKDSVK